MLVIDSNDPSRWEKLRDIEPQLCGILMAYEQNVFSATMTRLAFNMLIVKINKGSPPEQIENKVLYDGVELQLVFYPFADNDETQSASLDMGRVKLVTIKSIKRQTHELADAIQNIALNQGKTVEQVQKEMSDWLASLPDRSARELPATR